MNDASTLRQLVLGILFVVALSILAFYSLVLNEGSFLGGRFEVEARFPEAYGLGRGDRVLVKGVRAGRVKDVVYETEAAGEMRVRVILTLDEWVAEALRKDANASIELSTFLGGRQLMINPGEAEEPAKIDGLVLIGRINASGIERLGELVDALPREKVEALLEGMDQFFEVARSGQGLVGSLMSDAEMAEEARRAITAIADAGQGVDALTDSALNGDGVFAALLNERALHDEALGALADVRAILGAVREGDGNLAQLVNDGTLVREAGSAAERLDRLLAGLEEGRGTFGQLLHDDTLAREAEAFVSALNTNEGLLGLLLHDASLATDVSAIADDLRQVSERLASGEGTLGKLMSENDLYDEVMTSVRMLNRSLEDFREAAPISSFTSVLFGAF